MKQSFGSHSSLPRVLIWHFGSLLGFISFIGMTLFFTAVKLVNRSCFLLEEKSDSLHLDSVRMRFKVIRSPAWKKCLMDSFSLDIGSWYQSEHREFEEIPAALSEFLQE